MKIETLKDRIAKAQARAEKKQNTINKKTEWIAKKTAKMEKAVTKDERIECQWDIETWSDDIERLQKEIKEIEVSIENYQKQLAGEMARESIFLTELPECVRNMVPELTERWDKFDKQRRDNIKKDHREMDYSDFIKKHHRVDYEFMYKTDDQIHNANEQAAKALVMDLYNRIHSITGEVTDWNGIYAEPGTWGMPVLTGVVIGKMGRASIESIYAGGYNIQRLHIRVLVHEF